MCIRDSPSPIPIDQYMQTFSFGATCGQGGEVSYTLRSGSDVVFEDSIDFFGHISLQFGYLLKQSGYTFTVVLEGNNCQAKKAVGFDIKD